LTKGVVCKKCIKEEMPFELNPIFIKYDSGLQRIEDVMYCDCHGILSDDDMTKKEGSQ